MILADNLRAYAAALPSIALERELLEAATLLEVQEKIISTLHADRAALQQELRKLQRGHGDPEVEAT